MYVSGCLGIDNDSKMVEGGAVGQARKALENLKHILEASGSSIEKVVKTTVLLASMDDYKAVNEEYAKGNQLCVCCLSIYSNLFLNSPSIQRFVPSKILLRSERSSIEGCRRN